MGTLLPQANGGRSINAPYVAGDGLPRFWVGHDWHADEIEKAILCRCTYCIGSLSR